MHPCHLFNPNKSTTSDVTHSILHVIKELVCKTLNIIYKDDSKYLYNSVKEQQLIVPWNTTMELRHHNSVPDLYLQTSNPFQTSSVWCLSVSGVFDFRVVPRILQIWHILSLNIHIKFRFSKLSFLQGYMMLVNLTTPHTDHIICPQTEVNVLNIHSPVSTVCGAL